MGRVTAASDDRSSEFVEFGGRAQREGCGDGSVKHKLQRRYLNDTNQDG